MTDRELLELAAKAAGYEPEGYVEIGIKKYLVVYNPETGTGGNIFDPRGDDGDAFRLMVKLGIDIEWRSDGRVAAYRHANANGHCFTAFESSREDRASATRLAITRTAAEIGRSME